MGGLNSTLFLDRREELSNYFGIKVEEHDRLTGRNKKLDEFLATKSLLTNSKTLHSFFIPKGMSKVAAEKGITYKRVISAMCCIGYGSQCLHTNRPNLKNLGVIIQALKLLGNRETPGETLIEERMHDRQGEALFRLIRPFFCHRFTEALVAMLGTDFCREYWQCNWALMESTLAALYRYIPRGWKKALGSRKLLKVVNAVGQVGLQGQDIASTIIGTTERHKAEAEAGIRLSRAFCSHLGPNSKLWEDGPLSFDDFKCFKMKIPSKHPEKVFRDLIELGERHVLERLNYYFGEKLLRGVRSAKFISNPYLSWDQAREKRNLIYTKIGGTGNPWSHLSWKAGKCRARKRCDPKLGWKASMLIKDYLSGTINCWELSTVNEVWKKLKNNKVFRLCEVINRMATNTRDLVCTGFLNLDPPINFEFDCCSEHFEIDLYLVTIRIRLDIPILDGFDWFNHLRKNHLLISFNSDEQLFLPRLCLPSEKFNKRSPPKCTPKNYKPRTQSLPHLRIQSLPLLENVPDSKCCPENHPLITMPASHEDHKCENCGDILKVRAIMHICVTCSWILCNSCFQSTDEKMKMRGKRESLSAVSSKVKIFDLFDTTSDIESRGTDIDSLLDLHVHLNDAREQKSNLSQMMRQLPHSGNYLSPSKRRIPMRQWVSGPTMPPSIKVISTFYQAEDRAPIEDFQDEDSSLSSFEMLKSVSLIKMRGDSSSE